MNVLLVSLGSEARQPHQEDVPSSTRKTYEYLLRIRKRLAEEIRTLRGANASAVIARLNPIIRGWACHYRSVVSAKVFNALDSYVFKLTHRWALRGHRNKSKTWVVDRYYSAFNTARKDRWVFGDRDSGAYLIKFSWIPIARHQMVKATASPDDPALTEYWRHRRARRNPHHWTSSPCACSRPKAAAAPSAGTTSYTPITNHLKFCSQAALVVLVTAVWLFKSGVV